MKNAVSKVLYAITGSIWTPLMLEAFVIGFIVGMVTAR